LHTHTLYSCQTAIPALSDNRTLVHTRQTPLDKSTLTGTRTATGTQTHQSNALQLSAHQRTQQKGWSAFLNATPIKYRGCVGVLDARIRKGFRSSVTWTPKNYHVRNLDHGGKLASRLPLGQGWAQASVLSTIAGASFVCLSRQISHSNAKSADSTKRRPRSKEATRPSQTHAPPRRVAQVGRGSGYSQSHPLRKSGIKKNKLGIFQGVLRKQ
jgi:hypothetical protein